jgi:hypothetical protein
VERGGREVQGGGFVVDSGGARRIFNQERGAVPGFAFNGAVKLTTEDTENTEN